MTGTLSTEVGVADGRSGAPLVPRAPVMADVARLAGVSHQTVSRVVNGHPQLRPATRLRVEEAIRQLGYRPNVAARTLASRRSTTIGVIGSRSGFWGPSAINRSLQVAGREAGYHVGSVDVPDLTRDAVGGALEHLRRHGVAGIVLIGSTEETGGVAAEHAHDVPVVVVEGGGQADSWTVGLDQAAGAELATRHLLELGHTRIVHLAGPLHWYEAQARLDGWRAALHDAGLDPTDHLEGDWTAACGYRLGADLARRRDVTAVFAANDHMAMGLLRALWEAGRSVPGDLSVVGFDDVPESAYLIPGLTTVRQDFATIGRRAIELLEHAIAGGEGEGPARLVEPELVVRGSTAPRGA